MRLTYWLSVLSELQQQGVKDVFLTSINNLPGFAEAIESLFHNTDGLGQQMCNSLKYVIQAEY